MLSKLCAGDARASPAQTYLWSGAAPFTHLEVWTFAFESGNCNDAQGIPGVQRQFIVIDMEYFLG